MTPPPARSSVQRVSFASRSSRPCVPAPANSGSRGYRHTSVTTRSPSSQAFMGWKTKQGSISNQTTSALPPVPRHHADARSELRLPADRRAGALDVLETQRRREHHEDHVARRHHEVVHHARPRHVDLGAAQQPPLRIGDVVAQEGRHEAVAEEAHLAGLGIELRMRRHRADELAPKSCGPSVSSVTGSSACGGPPSQSASSRPACQTMFVLAAFGARPRDARIARRQVSEAAEERLAGRALERETRRAHPAIAVRRAAIAQAEGVDHAVAIEPVIAAARRELRIRAIAIQRSV